MSTFRDQFARPSGIGGHVAGWLMALSNRQLNVWAVDLLAVRPADQILEVGFGPGLAIQELSKRARSGRVVGVDPSPPMVRQAAGRNAAGIRAGRVELRQGSVSRLPFADGLFDKVLAVNNVQFWDELDADLAEVSRVLRPGGRLVIVLQPRYAPAEAEVLAVRDLLAEQVARAGYRQVRTETNPLKPMPAFAVLASR